MKRVKPGAREGQPCTPSCGTSSSSSGHISHQENSHVSLVRFCEATFGLAPLNQRDAASNGMSDCFDFAQQPLAPP